MEFEELKWLWRKKSLKVVKMYLTYEKRQKKKKKKSEKEVLRMLQR